MTASVVVVGDRLALVLAAIRYPDGCSIYLADPGREQFVVETSVPWGTISSSEAAAGEGRADRSHIGCSMADSLLDSQFFESNI